MFAGGEGAIFRTPKPPAPPLFYVLAQVPLIGVGTGGGAFLQSYIPNH